MAVLTDRLLSSAVLEVDESEPLDYAAVHQMFFDYFGDVFGCYLAVPDAFGIDEDGGADGAEADGAAVRENDGSVWVAAFGFFSVAELFRFEFAFEGGFYVCASHG